MNKLHKIVCLSPDSHSNWGELAKFMKLKNVVIHPASL